MPMPKEKIVEAIVERMTVRWFKLLVDEGAAPIAVIAIKQLPGKDFGTPVMCSLQDMDNDQLADLLLGISRRLRRA